jgi:HSP20 family protein
MPVSRNNSTQDRAQQTSKDAGGANLQRQSSIGALSPQRYSGDPFATPFRTMRRISEDMDRFFDRAFGDFALGRNTPGLGALAGGASWSPRIEAFQKDSQFIVRAELPGLKKEDVRVNVSDSCITIEGERRHEFEENRDGVFHTERSYGSFFREIPLPEGAIGDKAEATFKDGVLEVKLDAPPREVARGRSIDIKQG